MLVVMPMHPKPPKHCRECPAWKKSAFRDLEDDALAKLAELKEPGSYERGAAISRQGEASDWVYCIGSGNAKVTRAVPGTGAESIVRIAGEGELLGYRCIFNQEKFRATSYAMVPTGACKVHKNFVFEMIDRDPRFAREMLSRMGSEIAAAEDHHHSFCQRNVRERVAEALLILKKKCGVETTLGCRLDIRMSRTELASWVGTAKETVVRCLSDFKEEKLIEQDGDFMVVTDPARLASIAGISAD